eukprot:TRINITY_DN6441_c0_g1_i1.p1 TRINITY_DN6441_c0_g1~~TRINITY_DN6441_c0_g1_i1.p1  ORF type:complete len:402 (-),score=28.19 TRINITY_DN6441_c0_g1_i1:813-2018(-)
MRMFGEECEYVREFEPKRVMCNMELKNGRYLLLNIAGEGTFSKVWTAFDREFQNYVAIKIPIDGSASALFSFKVEIDNLIDVMERGVDNKHCVTLRDVFKIYDGYGREYPIMVMDLLGMSLRQCLDSWALYYPLGLPQQTVRFWTYQVLQSLRFLHDDVGLVHTDLKMENLLLQDVSATIANCQYSGVNVADFGNAVPSGFYENQYVPQTQNYRSPEAILGYSILPSMDMWSVGCIVFELLTGRPLFDMCCSDEFVNNRHLEEMFRVLGAPSSKKFLLHGRNSAQYLNSKGQLLSSRRRYGEFESGTFERMLKEKFPHIFGQVGCELLVDFLKQCLCWDPQQRISAKKALMHPWITGYPYQQVRCLGCYGGTMVTNWYCGGEFINKQGFVAITPQAALHYP